MQKRGGVPNIKTLVDVIYGRPQANELGCTLFVAREGERATGNDFFYPALIAIAILEEDEVELDCKTTIFQSIFPTEVEICPSLSFSRACGTCPFYVIVPP